MFRYRKFPLRICAKITILLGKDLKYTSSFIFLSLQSLEVLLFTETGNRSNTRSLRIQAHCHCTNSTNLMNSSSHCNIQNGSSQANGCVVLHGGRKPFYHVNSGSNPSCLSVLWLVRELHDGSLCLWHSQGSKLHIYSLSLQTR